MIIAKDDEDYCDICGYYRDCIEILIEHCYYHICYKCIDEIKPKELSLYSNTKDPYKEELDVNR